MGFFDVLKDIFTLDSFYIKVEDQPRDLRGVPTGDDPSDPHDTQRVPATEGSLPTIPSLTNVSGNVEGLPPLPPMSRRDEERWARITARRAERGYQPERRRFDVAAHGRQALSALQPVVVRLHSEVGQLPTVR